MDIQFNDAGVADVEEISAERALMRDVDLRINRGIGWEHRHNHIRCVKVQRTIDEAGHVTIAAEGEVESRTTPDTWYPTKVTVRVEGKKAHILAADGGGHPENAPVVNGIMINLHVAALAARVCQAWKTNQARRLRIHLR